MIAYFSRKEFIQPIWNSRKGRRKFKKEVAEGKRSGVYDNVFERFESKTFLQEIKCFLFGPPWLFKIHSIERPFAPEKDRI